MKVELSDKTINEIIKNLPAYQEIAEMEDAPEVIKTIASAYVKLGSEIITNVKDFN